MRDLGLPARIRAKGVQVVLVPGWESRGSSDYDPDGSVNHHTAGSSRGSTPSLGICTYGRSGLSGPLCQVLQSREVSGWDKAYVVAAGRANHAGRGGWRGLSGNTSVSGLEIEHIGTASVTRNRLEVAARIQAALLEAPGSSRDAGYLAQHFEWTSRKIDFNNLAPHFTPASFRARVQYWIGRTISGPVTPEDDSMSAADVKALQGFIGNNSMVVIAELEKRMKAQTDAVVAEIGRNGMVQVAENEKRMKAQTAVIVKKLDELIAAVKAR